MADIIVRWLADRVGCIFEVNSERFIEGMKSGILLAHILHSYGLFSVEQVQEVSAGTMNTLEVFKTYLKKMGIVYNEDIHKQVTSGNISASIKLLYHLYLSLQNKDKLQHVAVAERKKIMMTGTERFSVTPVCEEARFVLQQDVHPFSEPLQSLDHIVKWHKEKHQSFVEQCKKDRQKYIFQLNAQLYDKNLTCKRTKPLAKNKYQVSTTIDDNVFDNASVNLSYDQLVNSQKQYEDAPIPLPNPEESKKIFTKLTARLQNKRASDMAGVKLKRALLNELWDVILKQQHDRFENSIIDEVLKQSIFEKQMVRKAFDIRQQKDTMFENRHQIEVELKKEAEENFCRDIFHSEVENQEKENLYYREKTRAFELHRRLYAEKQRLNLEKTTEMCQKIVNDFADMAMYAADYKTNYQVECTPMQKMYLTALFQNDKPIFDTVVPIEDILNYDPDDCDEEMEEIYTMELSRHDAIMDKLLTDYLEMNWPWQINLADEFTPEELDAWHLGTNILGYIVHRLLLTKYPRPVPPPPPDLPKVPIAVCVNGLENLAIITPLKEILKERMIEVIEMQDPINYCLKIFNEETTVEYTDTLFEREERELREQERKGPSKSEGKGLKKTKSQKQKAKSKPPRKGSKSISLKQKSKSEGSSKEDMLLKSDVPVYTNKGEQTPKLFPWEEIVHTPAGELGRIAYNILNAGEPMHNYLVSKMCVQYLVSLKSKPIGGWVLVNFPNTISDAAYLEEELSSIPVPCLPGIEEADLNDYVKIFERCEVPENQINEDINEQKRLSKILPYPNKGENPEYKTTLTAFISLKQVTDDDEDLNLDKFIIESPTEPLQAFYYYQGCKYDLLFKLWDFGTLKTLAKLIVGDYSLPRQTSVQMLGPSIEYLEATLDILTGIDMPPLVRQKAATKKDSKKTKTTKSSKPSTSTTKVAEKKGKKAPKDKKAPKAKKEPKDKKSSKKGGSSKGSKKSARAPTEVQLPLVLHKETQIPEVEEVEEVVEVKAAKPGEDTWKYVTCSIPEEFQCALATLWESIEEVYINDLKELFFRRRVLLDSVIPYIAFVKTHMQRFITRPDTKQKHLHDFQKLYNQLDQDMRDDEELKAELHCRIFEFKNKLYDICDQRMNENEQERQRLIEDNWPIKTIIELINVKITMMQIQVDTFVDTAHLITEYYYGMVTKTPTTDVLFNKIRLTKIMYDEETSDNQIVKLISFTDQLLKSNDPITSSFVSPFHDIITKSHQTAMDFVHQTYQNVTQSITKLAAVFKPKEGKKKEVKPKAASKKSKADPKKMHTILIPDPDVIESAENLIEEYKCALEAVYIVVQIRLSGNLFASKKLFNSVLKRNKDAFLFIYHAIEQRYKRESSSIELACSVLSRAVEAECKIQPQLMLVGDEFLVEPDVLLFQDDLPKDDGALLEGESKYIYTIQQLQGTLQLYRLFAPNNILPERTFNYILQDVVVHNPEDGSPWLIPPSWRQLKSTQVSKLLHDLFGDTEYIDCREYILFNLMMKFPKSHEILAMRYYFREQDPDDTELVYEHQYQAVTLWFEKPEYDLDNVADDATLLRRKLIKKLLWNCYKIDEDRINYTALLLALCKDRFASNGIAKALSLSLGKEVCQNYDLGEMYLNAELDRRRKLVYEETVRQIEHEDNIDIAQEMVKGMTETVLDECDSDRLVLEEIIDIPTEPVKSATVVTEVVLDEQIPEEDLLEFDIDSASLEHVFSNVEIGFEEFDFPNLVYILPFDALINVLATALPWIFSRQCVGEDSLREKIEALYESLRIPDLDNNVYVHRFFNSPELPEIFKNITKFTVKYPVNTVFDILENN